MRTKFSSLGSLASLVLLLGLFFSVCSSQDEDEPASPEESTKIEPDPGTVYVSPQVSGDACYLAENFDSGNINVFKSRWVKSEAKKEGVDEDIAQYEGEWNIEAAGGNPLNGDLGLVLKSTAKHHAVAAHLDRPFRFANKSPLVIQYDVRFQEGMECGGAYIKLLSEDDSFQLAAFGDKTPYTIMFGPDKCGNDLKLHFIFRFQNPVNKLVQEKHLVWEKTDAFKHIFSDRFSHLLTLTLEPDSKFEVSLDQTVLKSGHLLEDFKPSVIPVAEIDDPTDVKPEDWDERAKIPDPESTKPEDWDESEPEKVADPGASKPEAWLDDEPLYIPDPRAEKPGDWDPYLDGEWEAPLIENPRCQPGCGEWKPPMIENPKYKGKWHAPQIENPNYKGVWNPKKMPNPDFFEETNPFEKLAPISSIGLELWSMSNNILFDNFVVTSDSEVAARYASETWAKKKVKERSGYASSDSVVDFLYKSADQNPWLWIVYALVVILPVTCCASYVLSKQKPKKKKTTGGAKSKVTLSATPIAEEHQDQLHASTTARDQLEVPEEEEPEEEPGSTGDQGSRSKSKATGVSKDQAPETASGAAGVVAATTDKEPLLSSKGDLEVVEDYGDAVMSDDEEGPLDSGSEEDAGETTDDNEEQERAPEDEMVNGDSHQGDNTKDNNDASAADDNDDDHRFEPQDEEDDSSAIVAEASQPRKRRSRKD